MAEDLVSAPAVRCTVSFWRYNLLNSSSSSDVGYAFLFNPSVLSMVQNSSSQTNFTVNFVLDTTSVLANLSGVTLQSCTIVGTTQPPGFTATVQPNGTLQASFNNGGLTSTQDYGFLVSVSYNGTTYTSSDPEIVLPPPNG